jgi:hypothetical protein
MIRGFPDDESLERLKFSEESVEHIWYSSSGEVVETTKTQTLTNKTLTTPTISDLNHTAQESIEIVEYT